MERYTRFMDENTQQDQDIHSLKAELYSMQFSILLNSFHKKENFDTKFLWK